jgi:hypothetical protein
MDKLIIELLDEDFLCQVGVECQRGVGVKIKRSDTLKQKILSFDPTLCPDPCRNTASSLLEKLILKYVNDTNVEQLSIMCTQVAIKIFGYASPSKCVFLSKLKSKIRNSHPYLIETIKKNYYFCGTKEEHDIRTNNREEKDHKVRQTQEQFTTKEIQNLIIYFTSSDDPWLVLMGLGLATGSRKSELLCCSNFYNYGISEEGPLIAMSNHIKDRKYKDPHCDMTQTEIEKRRNLSLHEQTKIAQYEKIHGIKNPELVYKPLLFLNFEEFENLLNKTRMKIKKDLNRELSIFPRRCISAEASHKIFASYTMAKHIANNDLKKTMQKIPNFHYLRAIYGSAAHILFNPTCSKTLYLKQILGHQSESTSAIYDKVNVIKL